MSNLDSAANARVVKNTVIMVALRVLMPALAIGLILLLSRYLGATGLGQYTLAFSFLYVFNAVAPLGLGAVITRDGARERAALGRLLGNSLTLGSIAAIVLTCAMIGLAYMLDYDDATRRALVVLSFAILPCTIGVFQDSALVALERMDYLAIATVIEYALKVGGGVALLLLGYGLEAVLIVAVLGRVVACVIAAQLLNRLKVTVSFSLDRDMLAKLLKLAPTFLFIGIFATLYWRIDVFMLSKLRPVEDVGYYGAAFRLLELVMVFPQSLCLSLYPQISQAALADLGQLKRIGRGAVRYLIALALPAAVAVSLLAEPILALLYGDGFSPAATTLAVLIWTLVPYGIVRYHAYVLLGANQQNVDLMLNVMMSIGNITLNLILIPRYGHLGAAVATCISICAYGLLQYAYLRIRLPGRSAPIAIPIAVLLATVAMAVAVWVMREANLFAVITVGAAVYAASLLAAGFFSASELELLGAARLRGMLARLPR